MSSDDIPEVPVISQNVNADQAIAIATSAEQARESNRYVSMRAKSVLVVGLVLSLSAVVTIFQAIGARGGTVLAAISFMQLGVAAILLLTKNVHTATLILRVIAALQLVTLLMSLANPLSLVVNMILLVLFLVGYYQVRNMTL